jgi:hypothetical protein
VNIDQTKAVLKAVSGMDQGDLDSTSPVCGEHAARKMGLGVARAVAREVFRFNLARYFYRSIFCPETVRELNFS